MSKKSKSFYIVMNRSVIKEMSGKICINYWHRFTVTTNRNDNYRCDRCGGALLDS
ncbi:MAG: hypothetical protein ACTSWK_08350 [Promethearchaeota archaeon]